MKFTLNYPEIPKFALENVRAGEIFTLRVGETNVVYMRVNDGSENLNSRHLKVVNLNSGKIVTLNSHTLVSSVKVDCTFTVSSFKSTDELD